MANVNNSITDETRQLLELVRQMPMEELERDILPLRDAIDIVSAKWKVEILTGIARGHTRFSELKAFVSEASEKMLAAGLKQLVNQHLIERTEKFGYYNRAEYRITEQGIQLFKIMFQMRDWGKAYRESLRG